MCFGGKTSSLYVQLLVGFFEEFFLPLFACARGRCHFREWCEVMTTGSFLEMLRETRFHLRKATEKEE